MLQNYKRILVALDIYSDYEKVIERALKVAASANDLHLVYVTLPQVYFEPYGMALTKDFTSEICEQAGKKLKQIAVDCGVPEAQCHLPVGPAAEAIHDLAIELDADLIVIGTHGQSGVRLLLGSTANAVLHGVKRDVLAVKV